MRQGWVVSIFDTLKKEMRYRIVWGTEQDAESQANSWWEKFRDKGHGARFRFSVSFPCCKYEQEDFRDVRCYGPSREALVALCDPFDASIDNDPDVPGGFIIEVYHEDLRGLLETLDANAEVEMARIIPDLSKLIDEAAEIKRKLDGQRVAESA